MIENLARMTDVEMEQSPVDIVVAATDDVPPLVSFNHSYTLRVSFMFTIPVHTSFLLGSLLLDIDKCTLSISRYNNVFLSQIDSYCPMLESSVTQDTSVSSCP